MSIADSEQYAHMLDAAAAGDYAYPAVNVTSSETLNAALRGFAAAESDGIVEMTTGGATDVSGAAVGQGELGARALASFAHEVGRECGVLVALHTDHCPPDQVDTFVRPLLGESLRRRERGEPPLFNSHMFDGSSLRLKRTWAARRSCWRSAHARGCCWKSSAACRRRGGRRERRGGRA